MQTGAMDIRYSHLLCRRPGTGRRSAGRLSCQSGSSMIEVAVIAVPLILVGLGSVEIAQWFFAKQAVSLALLEAARAGSTDHANPDAIKTAFEKALTPLYARPSKARSSQALNSALDQRHAQTGMAPWQIEVLSPTPQAFHDFADPSLWIKKAAGLAVINNHYLFEQDQRRRRLGWNNGQGAASGMTIFQANTLVLRLTYLHEPVLPGIKGLIRMLAPAAGSYGQRAMATGGYLPLKQEIALVMQSHPVNWPSLPSGKVITEAAHYTAPLPALECKGLWCMKDMPALPGSASGPGAPGAARADPGPDRTDAAHIPSNAGPPTASQAPASPQGGVPESSLSIAPEDPACGLTVCCVPG